MGVQAHKVRGHRYELGKFPAVSYKTYGLKKVLLGFEGTLALLQARAKIRSADLSTLVVVAGAELWTFAGDPFGAAPEPPSASGLVLTGQGVIVASGSSSEEDRAKLNLFLQAVQSRILLYISETIPQYRKFGSAILLRETGLLLRAVPALSRGGDLVVDISVESSGLAPLRSSDNTLVWLLPQGQQARLVEAFLPPSVALSRQFVVQLQSVFFSDISVSALDESMWIKIMMNGKEVLWPAEMVMAKKTRAQNLHWLSRPDPFTALATAMGDLADLLAKKDVSTEEAVGDETSVDDGHERTDSPSRLSERYLPRAITRPPPPSPSGAPQTAPPPPTGSLLKDVITRRVVSPAFPAGPSPREVASSHLPTPRDPPAPPPAPSSDPEWTTPNHIAYPDPWGDDSGPEEVTIADFNYFDAPEAPESDQRSAGRLTASPEEAKLKRQGSVGSVLFSGSNGALPTRAMSSDALTLGGEEDFEVQPGQPVMAEMLRTGPHAAVTGPSILGAFAPLTFSQAQNDMLDAKYHMGGRYFTKMSEDPIKSEPAADGRASALTGTPFSSRQSRTPAAADSILTPSAQILPSMPLLPRNSAGFLGHRKRTLPQSAWEFGPTGSHHKRTLLSGPELSEGRTDGDVDAGAERDDEDFYDDADSDVDSPETDNEQVEKISALMPLVGHDNAAFFVEDIPVPVDKRKALATRMSVKEGIEGPLVDDYWPSSKRGATIVDGKFGAAWGARFLGDLTAEAQDLQRQWKLMMTGWAAPQTGLSGVIGHHSLQNLMVQVVWDNGMLQQLAEGSSITGEIQPPDSVVVDKLRRLWPHIRHLSVADVIGNVPPPSAIATPVASTPVMPGVDAGPLKKVTATGSNGSTGHMASGVASPSGLASGVASPSPMALGSMLPGTPTLPTPSFAPMFPPLYSVTRNEQPYKARASIIPFWRIFGLQPNAEPRDIALVYLSLSSPRIAQRMQVFFDTLKATYESCGLGHLELPARENIAEGCLNISTDVEYVNPDTVGDLFETEAAQFKARIAELGDKRILVFMLYPPNARTSPLPFVKGFQSIRTAHSNVRWVLGSIETIASRVGADIPHSQLEMVKLALMIYDRWVPRLNSSNSLNAANPPPRPAFSLARLVPHSINIKFTTNVPGQIFDEDPIMHLSYAVSHNMRWVAAAWTDQWASVTRVEAFELGRSGALGRGGGAGLLGAYRSAGPPLGHSAPHVLADIMSEIWARTLALCASKSDHLSHTRWRIAVARTGTVSVDELASWLRVAEAVSPHKHISVSLFVLNLPLGRPLTVRDGTVLFPHLDTSQGAFTASPAAGSVAGGASGAQPSGSSGSAGSTGSAGSAGHAASAGASGLAGAVHSFGHGASPAPGAPQTPSTPLDALSPAAAAGTPGATGLGGAAAPPRRNDSVIVSTRDETHGIVFDNTFAFLDSAPVLVTGMLVKPLRSGDERGHEQLTVNLVHAPGSTKHIIKQVMAQYRRMASLAETTAVSTGATILPWHIEATNKMAAVLSGL